MSDKIRDKCAHVFAAHSGVLSSDGKKMATQVELRGKTAFSMWKYKHYFNLIEGKGKNVHVTCTLCPSAKTLSTSSTSYSNLLKHLSTAHAACKLVARKENESKAGELNEKESRSEGPTPSKQLRLNFSAPQSLVTQSELYSLIGRYVVENMLPLATVDSDSFRALVNKIPRKVGVSSLCRKTLLITLIRSMRK